MVDLNNEFSPVCEDCADTAILSLSDLCFSANSIEESEIQEIYFSEPHATNVGEPKNPITGWTITGLAADASVNEAAILAWLAARDQDGTGTLKSLKGIGNKPAPTSTDVTGPEGKTARIGKTHQILFDLLTVDNLNYAALQSLDACGGEVHIWYRTNKYIYGGINGIKVSILGAPHILDRGIGSIARNEITAQWKAETDPARDFYPALTSGS